MKVWLVVDWNRRIFGAFSTEEKAEAAITKLQEELDTGLNTVEVPLDSVHEFGIRLP